MVRESWAARVDDEDALNVQHFGPMSAAADDYVDGAAEVVAHLTVQGAQGRSVGELKVVEQADSQPAAMIDVNREHFGLRQTWIIGSYGTLPAAIVAVALDRYDWSDLFQPIDDLGGHQVAGMHDEVHAAEGMEYLRPEMIGGYGDVCVGDEPYAHGE